MPPRKWTDFSSIPWLNDIPDPGGDLPPHKWSGPLSNQMDFRREIGPNSISMVGFEKTIKRIDEINYFLSASSQQLYDRVGNRILDWIHKNFDAEGLERAWTPLTPGTIFKNKTLGRGTKILEGRNDKLRNSFRVKAGKNEIRIGSPLKEAIFADRGTRLHWITPTNKQYLAFPWQGQTRPSSGHVASRARIKHVWRSTKKSPKALEMQKLGGTKKAFGKTPFGFFKEVRHNQMGPRRLFPSPQMTRALIEDVLIKYLEENLQFLGDKF